MTDYLEPLLDQPEDEEARPLLSARGRRASRRPREGAALEERVRTATAAEEGRETAPVPDSSAAKTAGGDDALYAAIERARRTKRRGERAERPAVEVGSLRLPRPGETALTRSRTEGRRDEEAWTTPDGAPSRTRYAQMVDAEFQRDARRYDGAMGLL